MRKGPSFLSFAAYINARNLLKPVVAAALPRAAVQVSTPSHDNALFAVDVSAFNISAVVTFIGREGCDDGRVCSCPVKA